MSSCVSFINKYVIKPKSDFLPIYTKKSVATTMKVQILFKIDIFHSLYTISQLKNKYSLDYIKNINIIYYIRF